MQSTNPTEIGAFLDEIAGTAISEEVSQHLLPYQVPHIQNLVCVLKRRGVALDCSDTGTGKSCDGPAIAMQMGLRILIVGPKAGIPNLYNMCDMFGFPHSRILGNVNYETLKNGKYYASMEDFYSEKREECPYINIVRAQAMHPITKQPLWKESGQPEIIIKRIEWELPPDTLVIFDEAHKGKNGKCSGKKTTNSKLITSLKPFLGVAKRTYGLFLSATLSDKLENFDVIAYMLGFYRPYQSKIYGQWLRRYGIDSSRVYKNIHSMLFPLYASRMSIRHIKEETGDTIFRRNDIQAEIYPVDKETAAQIEKSNRKIRDVLTHVREKGVSFGFGRIIRYWQRIEALKVDTVAKLIVEYASRGMSIVVFVNFTETKMLLYDQVLELCAGKPYILAPSRIDFIDGSQKAEEKELVVTRFMRDESHLVIANIKAGGTALSLHDITGTRQRVSLIFPTWSVTDLKQSLGRIYRANSKTDAIQRIVYCTFKHSEEPAVLKPDEPECEDRPTLSIEEMLCRSVNEKLINIELLNNGDLYELLKLSAE